jgi:hypothetical protein
VSITGFSGPDEMPASVFATSSTPRGGNNAATGYQTVTPANPHTNTLRRLTRSPTALNASAPTTEPAPTTPIINPRLTALP